jgi:hypothetical protein
MYKLRFNHGSLPLYAWICWIGGIATFFAVQVLMSPPSKLLKFIFHLPSFFLWQFILYITALILANGIKKKYMGHTVGACLLLSSFFLLAASQNAQLFLTVVLFLIWIIFSINSMRWVLNRMFSEPLSSFGIAAVVFYAVLIFLSFFLGILHLIYPPLLAAMALLLAIPGAADSYRNAGNYTASIMRFLQSIDLYGLLLMEVIWILLSITLICSTVPDLASDAIRGHIPVIKNFSFHNGIDPAGGHIDFRRMLPMTAQTCFALFYSVGGILLTKLFSWFTLIGLASLVAETVTERVKGVSWGLFASSAVISYPFLSYLSTSLYNDHVLTFLCFGVFAILFKSISHHSGKGLFLSAFVLGITVQIKYNALLITPVWAVLVLVFVFKSGSLRSGLKQMALIAIFLALIASPWYIYTWFTTGNPIYPYANGLFKSPYFPENLKADFHQNTWREGMGQGLMAWLQFPWTLTFATQRICPRPAGWAGFWILALLPSLFSFFSDQKKSGSVFALSGLGLAVLIIWTTPNPRYWLSAVPLIITGSIIQFGLLAEKASPCLPGFLNIAASLVLFFLILMQLPVWIYPKHSDSLSAYLHHASRNEFLSRKMKNYAIIHKINHFLSPSDKIICTGYEGVDTINGQAFEFPAWYYVAVIQKIHKNQPDSEIFTNFVKDNHIDYWIYDYRNSSDNFVFSNVVPAIAALYLDKKNLVYADGGVAVYKLNSKPDAFPKLITCENRLLSLPPASKWVREGERYAFRFIAPTGASLSKTVITLNSPSNGWVRVTIAWFNRHDQALTRATTWQDFNRDWGEPKHRFKAYAFSQLPIDAKFGELTIAPCGKLTMTPLSGGMEFFKDAPASKRPVSISEGTNRW